MSVEEHIKIMNDEVSSCKGYGKEQQEGEEDPTIEKEKQAIQPNSIKIPKREG